MFNITKIILSSHASAANFVLFLSASRIRNWNTEEQRMDIQKYWDDTSLWKTLQRSSIWKEKFDYLVNKFFFLLPKHFWCLGHFCTLKVYPSICNLDIGLTHKSSWHSDTVTFCFKDMVQGIKRNISLKTEWCVTKKDI